MKKNITNFLFVLMLAVFSATVSYSAFPVVAEKTTSTQTVASASNQSVTEMNSVLAQNDEQAQVITTKAKSSVGSSQLIALLLCLFVGGLGIHRFYLGYTTEGVIQLLTAGGCGIWSLIDLIRIITGDLQPKSGSYSQTL